MMAYKYHILRKLFCKEDTMNIPGRHKVIFEEFLRLFPMYKGKIKSFKGAGKNTIFVEMAHTNKGFIFSYYSETNYCLATEDYIKFNKGEIK